MTRAFRRICQEPRLLTTARTFLLIVCLAAPSAAGTLRLAELDTETIRALDRPRTAIIIPGGVLEEHGPYLPSYTDGYVNESLAAKLASAIGQRPGWTAVVFPTIPLGSGGANEIRGKYVFPGTYTVRPATVRAVFMDLATELGEQGFIYTASGIQGVMDAAAARDGLVEERQRQWLAAHAKASAPSR